VGEKKNPDFEKKPSLYSRTGDEAEVSSILIRDPPADASSNDVPTLRHSALSESAYPVSSLDQCAGRAFRGSVRPFPIRSARAQQRRMGTLAGGKGGVKIERRGWPPLGAARISISIDLLLSNLYRDCRCGRPDWITTRR
jgi:hypothetical protein